MGKDFNTATGETENLQWAQQAPITHLIEATCTRFRRRSVLRGTKANVSDLPQGIIDYPQLRRIV